MENTEKVLWQLACVAYGGIKADIKESQKITRSKRRIK